MFEAFSPFSDEEGDGRDEADDADEGGEVACGRLVVHDADVLALLGVPGPSLRGDAPEDDDREELGRGENNALREFAGGY